MSLVKVLTTLELLNQIMSGLPEPVKRFMDAELDKLEDKKKEGSIEDRAIEMACAIIRGKWKIPEFEDVLEEDKPAPPKVTKSASNTSKPKVVSKAKPKGRKASV